MFSFQRSDESCYFRTQSWGIIFKLWMQKAQSESVHPRATAKDAEQWNINFITEGSLLSVIYHISNIPTEVFYKKPIK